MAIKLERRPEGILLPVAAQPGGRRSAIRGEHDGALKVSVTAAPEKGKANKSLITVLARSLGIRRGSIELISGETSRAKKFLIRDVTLEEVQQAIDNVLAEL